MMSENIQALVTYRLEQADESLEEQGHYKVIYVESWRNVYPQHNEVIKKPQSIKIAANFIQVVPKAGFHIIVVILVCY